MRKMNRILKIASLKIDMFETETSGMVFGTQKLTSPGSSSNTLSSQNRSVDSSRPESRDRRATASPSPRSTNYLKILVVLNTSS